MTDGRRRQKGNPTSTSRRRFTGALGAGLLAAMAGCGGSGEDYRPPMSPWQVDTDHALTLRAGVTFDLAATLPGGVAPGGVFDVDPSGAPLPAGTTLSRQGVLSVGPSASGSASGVIFRYTPPA